MASTKYDLVDLGDSRISSETECRQHLQRDRTNVCSSATESFQLCLSRLSLFEVDVEGWIKQFCKQASNSHQVPVESIVR